MYLSSPEFKNRRLGVTAETDQALVSLEGFEMYVSPSDLAVGKHIYAARSYETHVTEAIKQRLGPDMVFIDIGANIGYFSLLAARLVGKEGRVVSFEPFQQNVQLLHASLKLNGFDNVEVYPFAVADKNALLAYDNMGSNGVVSEAASDLSSLLLTTLVWSITLDSLLRDIPGIDVIKIDVEGAEYLAMIGGLELLKKCRPTIFSEFSPPALENVSKVSAEIYLQLLLIDERYFISVINPDGSLIDCGRDIHKVIGYFEDSGSDHIDIVASAAPK
jgi:FkbM family methyltransferase